MPKQYFFVESKITFYKGKHPDVAAAPLEEGIVDIAAIEGDGPLRALGVCPAPPGIRKPHE